MAISPKKPCGVKYHHVRFALGVLAATAVVFTLAEIYLRSFPPNDLHPYLGDDSPLTGIFRSDPGLAAHYQSWQAFYADNQKRLQPFVSPKSGDDGRPIWAFFGNSFVHARGMLGDQALKHVRYKRIFFLGRNELLFVRVAQIELLLEQGINAEKIFFGLMPVDCLVLGKQPLDTVYVNRAGAITYKPRLPKGLVGKMVHNSRTCLTGWIRSGQHLGNPEFRRHTIQRKIHPVLLQDLQKILSRLTQITSKHNVPTTIMLIPTYQQIMGEEPFGFQDALIPMLCKMGFDVFDPRSAFRKCASPSLFVPDRHFSHKGNQILLDELLRHVGYAEKAPANLAAK